MLDPATNCVTDDKFLMCKLLVDQFNSVFTTPDQSKIVIDPELFFSVDENSVNESPHLSTIVFTDEIVLLAINFRSSLITLLRVRMAFQLHFS